MGFFSNELEKKYKTVYNIISDNKMFKKYVNPKIYHGGKTFDLKKRWYVYYSFIDPDTGNMKRQTPISLKVNKNFKTKTERLLHLNYIKKALEKLLKDGLSPYDNEKLDPIYSAESCIDYALDMKRKEIRETTFKEYLTRVNKFKKFLKSKDILNSSIKEIQKKHVSEFLNKFSGAKSSNNYKTVLSSIFSILSDESYVDFNFISEIRNKKVEQKPVKIYSQKQVSKIILILEKENIDLLMYIYFISYMFWREIENVRIKVSDIDFEKNTISVRTKTKFLKTKIIPKILVDKLKKFVENKSSFIFEYKDVSWEDTSELNRRDQYIAIFSKFRKKHNIDSEFKLYSFRHTYITKIYLQIRKNKSKEDSVKELSLITGHESKAIYKYIQVNDVELPKDYSQYLV